MQAPAESPEGEQRGAALFQRLKFSLQPVTVEQGRTALLAFWRFGRGLHPAGLNFGDYFTYALARITGEPLLSKGNDFGQTDLRLVS